MKRYETAYLYRGHIYCGIDAVLSVIDDNNLLHYRPATCTVEEDLDALAKMLNVDRAVAKPRFFPQRVTRVPGVRCHRCKRLL